jgi:hypothetical protein
MSRLEPIPFPQDDLPQLPRAHVWDCLNQAQTLAATFEVHEAAMAQGFLPEEATTLSLVLAELAMRACRVAKGSVASVFFAADGWRVEVAVGSAVPTPSAWRLSESALLRSLTSVRVHETPGVGTVLLAEQRREAYA